MLCSFKQRAFFGLPGSLDVLQLLPLKFGANLADGSANLKHNVETGNKSTV